MINSNGDVSTISGTGEKGFKDGPSNTAMFKVPLDVCIDSGENKIIADTCNNRIRMNNSNGDVSTLSGNGSQWIQRWSFKHSNVQSSTWCVLIQMDNIIVADTLNHRIRMINSNGDVSTISGTGDNGFKDGPSNTAMFNWPHSVCIDSDGNIIVADTLNHRIRMINSNGDVSTISGTGDMGFKDGPSNTAMFNHPGGVCIDSNGNIIVDRHFNNRIRMINSNGDVSTISGTGEKGFKDGPLNTAMFNYPYGVCIDSDGDIIVVRL